MKKEDKIRIKTNMKYITNETIQQSLKINYKNNRNYVMKKYEISPKKLKKHLIKIVSSNPNFRYTFTLSYTLTIKNGYEYVLNILNEILYDKRNYYKDNEKLEKDLKIYYDVLIYPISKSGMCFCDFRKKISGIIENL